MAYLALLLATFLVRSGVLDADVPPSGQSIALPTLNVSVSPHTGNIPAGMANGRPVYKFAVSIIDPENKIWALDDILLQAGMTRQLVTRGRPTGELRGVVRIDRTGVVSYQVAFTREGRSILSAATYIGTRAE